MHVTSAKFRLVSTAVAIVLTLHVPGRLDLIMNGTSAGTSFSGVVVFSVTNQLNAIIATMVNVIILFVRIPFGININYFTQKEF